LDELVSAEAVERLFRYLAVFGPIFGLLIGGILGWGLRKGRKGIVSGIIVGCFGPANYALWKLSGAITAKLGLDSVANLLIQVGMFVILGFAIGILIGKLRGAQPRTT